MGIVGLCSDHAGFELKEYIKTILDEGDCLIKILELIPLTVAIIRISPI